MRLRPVVFAAIAVAALVAPAGAFGAFTGANGKIGYVIDPAGPGSTQITTIDPDGQNRLELTSGADQHYDPSFSADGERIVFASAPPATTPGQIWVMNHDGSDQTQLTAGTPNALDLSPEFSPDGRTIVFDRYNGMATTQVWAMSPDGGGETQLTTASDSSRSPSFSPDGSRIAFTRQGPGGGGIWVMNADGSDPTPLTPGSASADDGNPSFSPDGRQIVFDRYNGSQSDIWVMNSDGSGQTPVVSGTQFDTHPTFSPDGSQIAFIRQVMGTSETLAVVPAAGGPVTSVPGVNDAYGQSQTTWQPLNPPSCDLTGTPKQRSVKSVTVTVTCQNEDASAIAQGSGQAPKPRGAQASRKKRFEIAPVGAQVPQGTPTAITLPIPKKGSKALKRATTAGRKGKATITATLTDDLGQSSTDTFAVKFKRKKR